MNLFVSHIKDVHCPDFRIGTGVFIFLNKYIKERMQGCKQMFQLQIGDFEMKKMQKLNYWVHVAT